MRTNVTIHDQERNLIYELDVRYSANEDRSFGNDECSIDNIKIEELFLLAGKTQERIKVDILTLSKVQRAALDQEVWGWDKAIREECWDHFQRSKYEPVGD